MKKILITGINGYIGSKLKELLIVKGYEVDTIDVKNNNWMNHDFSSYSTVVHSAGLVHKIEKRNDEDLYFRVNSDLTYHLARKAKHDGVNHFIFMSSMSVYGIESGTIGITTPTKPTSFYGKSKLEGEKRILKIESDSFKISVIRPPMVYGEGCGGNYKKLSAFSGKFNYFPDVKNQRSMIYIGNLCEFLYLIIRDCKKGIFHPQNNEFVCTSDLVKLISSVNKTKMTLLKGPFPLIKLLKFSVFLKIFGDLVYDQKLSEHDTEYRRFDFKESIIKTEGDT